MERSFSKLCSSPISIITLSKMPTVDLSPTGMLSPHCTIYCNKPTVLRHTDLPPALGPEIIRICLSLLRMMSRGTTFFPCFSSDSCNKGCRDCIQSTCGLSVISGSIAFVSFANSALARIKSIVARKEYDSKMSREWGRTLLVKVVRMRIIS